MSKYFDGLDQAMIDAMEQQYDGAEVKRKYVELPEGDYQAYVDRFLLQDSKKNQGEFGLVIGLKVVNGPYAGSTVSKYIPIEIDTMERLKADLTVLMFRYDGITSLEDEERMREMLDVLLDIRVTRKTSTKNGKTYTNIWLNRNLGYYEHTNELQGEVDYASSAPPWGQR